MSPVAIALARRAVACPRWAWRPGMRYFRWSDAAQRWGPGRLTESSPEPLGQGEALPDLSDPATVGALLALVREAWSGWDMELVRERVSGQWGAVLLYEIEGGGEECFWSHADDGWAEALVAALENAP